MSKLRHPSQWEYNYGYVADDTRAGPGGKENLGVRWGGENKPDYLNIPMMLLGSLPLTPIFINFCICWNWLRSWLTSLVLVPLP